MTHCIPKRLLIFIFSLSSGGAERVTANLANYWAGKGWQVAVATLSDTSLDFYHLAPSVHRIALHLAGESKNPAVAVINNLRRILKLRQVLREFQPDIALSMMDTANILLAMASAALPGIVAVGSEHIHPPQLPLGRIWTILRRYCYGRLATIVALTSESRDWLLSNSRVKKVAVIPNAVPWPLPTQLPLLMPQEILPPDRKILLAVGRLCEQKGFDLLINVFANLAPQFFEWDLAILGEGPLRSSLAQQIGRTGLTQRIHLVGRVGNIADWYNSADLYVMSSRFEGFGNTLAEALAHGLPAVSFDCDTGPRDIIRHEVDGLLVPNGDTAALQQALSRLMTDESLRHQFAVKAVEARERFSLEKIAGMWEELFEETKKK